MRESTHLHFKFTPRTTAVGVFYAFIIPYGVFQFIKWDKKRHDKEYGRKVTYIGD